MKKVRKNLGVEELERKGLTGKGITVAVLDSGISMHPDLRKQVMVFQDFVNNKKEPYDDMGHGTHVSGIIAGNGFLSRGIYRGIAPEAKIVSLKVLNEQGNGNLENVLEGIHWIIDWGFQYGIRVVNLSFGARYTGKPEDWILMKAVRELWNLGYVVVASAGNNGPEENSIAVPGRCEKVITVGAQDDDLGAMVNGIYKKNYSGRGNPMANIQKPDIVAPAYKIQSCSNRWKKGRRYEAKTGTSMATPIISGIIALMLQKNPKLSNDECKKILKRTALPIGTNQGFQGYGKVHLKEIMNRI